VRAVVAVFVLVACADRAEPVASSASAPTPSATTLAGTPAPPPPGASTQQAPNPGPDRPDAGASDPAGFHLDDATIEYQVDREQPRRKGRPIEVLLRSSPPGAVAAVDGEALGPTPILWQGNADGRPREFTFVLPGFASARYRFVPVRDGVVHGTLDRLKLDARDAGP
jgi:hypothetical protein